MSEPAGPFADPAAVARYAEGPPRHVPGYAALQRMAGVLLAERAPDDARVLVLGAGGGLELRAFAEARPGWTFDGVDPSTEMLALAERTLGPLAPRARLHRGTIDDAPEGPFDAATCLLTLHYLPPDERRRTVAAVRRRLKPGAPFVVAHFSVPQGDSAGDKAGDEERARWLSRYAAFKVASGITPDAAARSLIAVDEQLAVLTPAQDEAVLRDAGFSGVTLFYVGFTFRGWVAYA